MPKQLKSQKEILISLGEEERKKLVAHLGRGMKGPKDMKQDIAGEEHAKFLVGRHNETIVVDKEESTKTDTIFLKDINNCKVQIKCRSAKILIESCHNSVITIGGLIMTNTLEIWKCNGCELVVNSKVSTIQVDLCDKLALLYKSRMEFFQVVWMGVEELRVNFARETDQHHSLTTGYGHMVEQLREENPGMVLSETIDQFIVRFVKEQMKCEQMVRLENGFPTTEREAADFDAKKKKNDAIMEKHLRKVIKVTEKKHGKEVSTVHDKKKAYEIETIQPGDGQEPSSGDRIVLLYRGKLQKDGTVFDEQMDREHPWSFTYDRGEVVPGFDDALGLFSKGMKANVKIAADAAYGVQGVHDKAKEKENLEAARKEKEAKNEPTKDLTVPPVFIIPPNSDLEFEIECLDIIRHTKKTAEEHALTKAEEEEVADSFLPDNLKPKPAKGKAGAKKGAGKKK